MVCYARKRSFYESVGRCLERRWYSLHKDVQRSASWTVQTRYPVTRQEATQERLRQTPKDALMSARALTVQRRIRQRTHVEHADENRTPSCSGILVLHSEEDSHPWLRVLASMASGALAARACERYWSDTRTISRSSRS